MSFAAFRPFDALQPFRVPLGLPFLAALFKEAALDLNFAKTKTLDSRITFTRASSGTYFDANGVMQTAANNVARFDHNPVTGESLGLLVEGSRTNLILMSQAFTTDWSTVALTLSADPVPNIAPDGGGAYEITSGTGNGYLFSQTSVVSGTTYAMSVFFKKPPDAGAVNIMQLAARSGGFESPQPFANFNIVTGAVTNSGGTGFVSASTQDVGGGWMRCVLVCTASSSSGTSGILVVFTSDDPNAGRLPSGGNTGQKAYVWGAQLEAGAFPTSYIPTTTAQVTRAADVATMTGTNFSGWHNAVEGTLATAFQFSSTVGNNRAIVQFDNGTNDMSVRLFLNGGNYQQRIAITGAIGQPYLQSFPATLGAKKMASAYKDQDTASSFEGSVPVIQAIGVPTGINILRIGNLASGAFYGNVWIKRLTYWGTRLPNATLEALTSD